MTRFKTRLISFVCFLSSFSAFSYPSAEEPLGTDKQIERITVYGQASIRQLKKDIRAKGLEFFREFNKVNDINQYAMVCKKEQRIGSNFRDTTCEPRFIRTNRAQLTAALVFGNDPSSLNATQTSTGALPPFALSRVSLVSNIGRLASSNNKKFYEHVAKLLESNPQLIKKYEELLDLQAVYAYKKANR